MMMVTMVSVPNKQRNRRATRASAGFFATACLATVAFPVVLCSAWMLRNAPPACRHRQPNRQLSTPGALCSTASSVATQETPNTNTRATGENSSDFVYRQLFPPTNASSNGTIQTETDGGDTGASVVHTLYYEIHGTGPLNALFLHGGPGAGCFPNHARFFDPSKYTVVLLDQRGAGRSTPRGCVEDNTLEHLVEDCELVRRTLLSEPRGGAAPWDCVLGGSWGATLGLAYAQRHPHAMRSLVLRGICTLRPTEVDWLFGAGGGSARALPGAWKNFSETVLGGAAAGASGREALHAYYDCLIGARTVANDTENNAIRLAAARSWMGWEMAATSSASSKQGGSNTTQQSSGAEKHLVLVSSPGKNNGEWRFENPLGEPVAPGDDDCDSSPQAVASRLRKHIDDTAEGTASEPFAETHPRPVRSIDESSMPLLAGLGSETGNHQTAGRFKVPPDYIPAQAMLTCYYSVNDRYVMGQRNNLVRNAARQSAAGGFSRMRIIGIQGGLDPICPPDTAMDLLEAVRNERGESENENEIPGGMELRVPLGSGHSMYDPGIRHELLKATDRIADELLLEQHSY